MTHVRTRILTLISLASIGCGPPAATAIDSSGETTNSEDPTESPTETGDSTDSESESESSTDTPTTVDSDSFIPEPDDRGEPSCDPWAQDCPAGEKCVPFASQGGSWDSNKCVPVLGDAAPGEPCQWNGATEATDDCDASSLCWNFDDEGAGTCVGFCTGSPDVPECPLGSMCLTSGSGVFNLCMTDCDPLVQDCDDELMCIWSGTGFSCVATGADAAAGDPCTFADDCAIGLFCVDAEPLPACLGSSCCTPYCELPDGDACAALPGTSCVAFYDEGEAPPNLDALGVCLAP